MWLVLVLAVCACQMNVIEEEIVDVCVLGTASKKERGWYGDHLLIDLKVD
jgi:hypothetical protein